jgi:hypothetical protein
MDGRYALPPAGALAFLLTLAAASAQVQPTPDITPPAGVTLLREVQAGGVQVYACGKSAAGTYRWTLVGPKAILVQQDGSDFGTHGAGPTWTAHDGSSITGDGAHPLAKVERTGSVPSLLLAVTASSGSGALSSVRFVRRSDTEGGLPPADGCDAAHEGATTASHYSAIYSFYR